MTAPGHVDTADAGFIHDRAELFVSRMNLGERVVWLQRQYVTDVEILDALLDDEDPDLDGYTREVAHQIATGVVNGNLERPPAWLAI